MTWQQYLRFAYILLFIFLQMSGTGAKMNLSVHQRPSCSYMQADQNLKGAWAVIDQYIVREAWIGHGGRGKTNTSSQESGHKKVLLLRFVSSVACTHSSVVFCSWLICFLSFISKERRRRIRGRTEPNSTVFDEFYISQRRADKRSV